MVTRVYRVYADTSVFGGVLDEEFQEASRSFFNEVARGRFVLVCSAVVDRELREAPEKVKEFYAAMLAKAEIAEVTAEALELQQAYSAAPISLSAGTSSTSCTLTRFGSSTPSIACAAGRSWKSIPRKR